MAADKDRDEVEPSLELPSFGFRRKKRRQDPEPVAEPEPVAREQRPEPDDTAVIEQHAPPAPRRIKERRERRPVRLPALPGLTAALVAGLLVGLLAVAATYGSLRLCELVEGTTSCGGPGLFLLVAILIALVYLGGWLLRAFGVDDPGSTSFLAVGLTATVAMLFLVDVLFAWWMVIAVPVVSMAAYAVSWWVTTSAAGTELD